MTSFIAACRSGRSTSVIPAVPAAWSVTTIAFIVRRLALSLCCPSIRSEKRSFRAVLLRDPVLFRPQQRYWFGIFLVCRHLPNSIASYQYTSFADDIARLLVLT